MNKLLSIRDASAQLKEHPQTTYKRVKLGEIPCIRKGRRILFQQQAIDEFLVRCTQKTTLLLELHPNKFDKGLQQWDKILLKGDSAVANKRQRWNYGGKGVFKRRSKKGESWCIWYYEKRGKVKKLTVRGATCREDAIRVLEAKVREIFNREHGIAKKTIGFVDFAAVYLEKYAKRKKRSWRTDEKFLNAQLIPFFGKMELSEITPEHVSDFITKREGERVKNSTIHKHLQVLRKMMNLADEFGYEIKKNPVRPFHFSNEAENQRSRVLDQAEEQRLIAAAAPHLKPIIRFALETGMRRQEILTLEIADVDFAQDVIRIRPEVNKSGKLDLIPLLPHVKELVRRLITENAESTKFVFNYLDPHTNELRPVLSIQHAFRTACRKARVSNLQFRDLRRTFSTRLHEKGLDPLIIQRLLRHSSFKISEEVYIQSSLRMMKEALEKASQVAEKPANVVQIRNAEKEGMPLTSRISMN